MRQVSANPPLEQQALRAKAFHPSGLLQFTAEEVEQSITSRFEKIARLHPARIALKSSDRAWTYETLNRTTNRIARAILDQRGAGSEPAALLFEPGIDAVAAIIGALKAGKFFLPVDPSFPQERIRYLLENSGAGLIVTNDSHADLAGIDAAIEAIPGVRTAATFGIPHRTLGEEVAAAVVREGDVACSRMPRQSPAWRKQSTRRVHVTAQSTPGPVPRRSPPCDHSNTLV